jgi:bifunctional DNase/RNase
MNQPDPRARVIPAVIDPAMVFKRSARHESMFPIWIATAGAGSITKFINDFSLLRRQSGFDHGPKRL